MKKILLSILSVLTLACGVITATPQAATAQVQVFQNCTGTNSSTAICKATSDKLFGPDSIWNNILNTLTFITGAISALMIVIGGLRYTLSGGDQGSISSAKNTILYAVIGLVLSLTSFAIVNFVLTRV